MNTEEKEYEYALMVSVPVHFMVYGIKKKGEELPTAEEIMDSDYWKDSVRILEEADDSLWVVEDSVGIVSVEDKYDIEAEESV